MRSFGSDNHSGAHPDVLAAVVEANTDHCVAYGADSWTEKANSTFQKIFGSDTGVYFVFNGTGANVLAVVNGVQRHEGVLCAAVSHMNLDECGAPEAASGSKLIPIDTPDGKLTVESIERQLGCRGFEHCVQPRMISLTQTNEYGLVYSTNEVRAICEFAHQNDLLVHMDGARISNAAAAQGIGLREASRDLGIDILSFGGSKNGLMLGEAVLFFGTSRFPAVKYHRKRIAQLGSKVRFLSAQFSAYLQNDLWLRNATHANRMAGRLASAIQDLPGVKVSRHVQSNMVWAVFDPALRKHLESSFMFYTLDEYSRESRLVTSWDTRDEDIALFANSIRAFAGGKK